MPVGRPTDYTPEIAKQICSRISAGESLRSICASDDFPAASTVCEWNLDNREGFSEQYARARKNQAELLADEILSIADDGANDTYVIDEETGAVGTNHDVINRSRLRVDTRKWYLSKVLPKVYGEKIDLNHSGEVAIKRVVTDV